MIRAEAMNLVHGAFVHGVCVLCVTDLFQLEVVLHVGGVLLLQQLDLSLQVPHLLTLGLQRLHLALQLTLTITTHTHIHSYMQYNHTVL